MSSVYAQILAKVEEKLDAVRQALDWLTLVRNPREPVGEDQLNAIVLMFGAEPDPRGLTGRVDERELEFAVGFLVEERKSGPSAEDLLDAARVAVSDALLDPNDIQLGGIASGVFQGGVSEPVFGRAPDGARYRGGLSMEFSVKYWAREGDASAPGP